MLYRYALLITNDMFIDSIEGLPCAATLTEELISHGARHPLPHEPLLKLRAGAVEQALISFCDAYRLDLKRCNFLKESVDAAIPLDALGQGDLQVPVSLDDSRVVRPTLTLRVNASLGGVHYGARVLSGTFLTWKTPLVEHASNVIALPERAPCSHEPFGREAAAFCVTHRCPNRIITAGVLAKHLRAYASSLPSVDAVRYARERVVCEAQGGSENRVRTVVSLSTLPGRIEHIATTQLGYLRAQTRPADTIYIAIPVFSTREQKEYVVPSELEMAANAGHIVLLRSEVDWGPATKLIPVLLIETAPQTVIVTIDDDINYPSTLLEELVAGATRHPNAAVGFRGYRLPPPSSDANASFAADGIDEEEWQHGGRKDEENRTYYSHSNLAYVDAANSRIDTRVDVLGGLAGVAYRSGFFDMRRLTDYSAWAGGAFYVDDDWISLVLEEAGVSRFILGSEASAAAHALHHNPIVAPHHSVSALNAPNHAFRNIAFQAELLAVARKKGLFLHHPCRFADSANEKHFLFDDAVKFLFAHLEAKICDGIHHLSSVPQGEVYDRGLTFVFVQAHAAASTMTVLFDSFLSHHGGVQFTVTSSARTAEEIDNMTSVHTTTVSGSAVRYLWNLKIPSTGPIDVLHIGSLTRTSSATFPNEEEIEPMRDLAAAFGSGLFQRGHTFLSVELDDEGRHRNVIKEFLLDIGCFEVAHSVKLSVWVCH